MHTSNAHHNSATYFNRVSGITHRALDREGQIIGDNGGLQAVATFNWRHNTAADDIITIGDTLGIRQLELHERNGVLFERMADGTLQPIQTHQLEGELSALGLLSPADLAKALTGKTLTSKAVRSESDGLAVG